MLNDLKDWAVEKSEQSREVAEGVALEVSTTSAMDWSGSVWLVIGAVLVFAVIGLANAAKNG